MELPEDSQVDLETATDQGDGVTEVPAQLPAGKAQLEFIASDARNVVLRFAE